VLREIAEYPNSFGPLGPEDERVETGRFTLCMAAGRRWNTVQRQHFRADEVDDVVDEVRSLLRARGRDRTQWEVGSSAEPPDLVELLLERGLVRDKDPYAVALVLTVEPPPAPPGIIARRVETFEEYVAASAVQGEAFGEPDDEIAAGAHAPGRNRTSARESQPRRAPGDRTLAQATAVTGLSLGDQVGPRLS
jgi:hypothetical protein